MAIEVTARDTETGESQTIQIEDNYVITTAGRCYVANEVQYRNGTTVLTIKTEPRPEASPG